MKSRFEGVFYRFRIQNKYFIFLFRILRSFLLAINVITQYCLRKLLRKSIINHAYCVCSLPKSGSSFLEVLLQKATNLPTYTSAYSNYRDTFHGESIQKQITNSDLKFISKFGGIFKTHSLPSREQIRSFPDIKFIFTNREREAAINSNIKHINRTPWHYFHGKPLDELAIQADYISWDNQAQFLAKEFNISIVNYESIQSDILNHLSFLNTNLSELYEKVLRDESHKYPKHYSSITLTKGKK